MAYNSDLVRLLFLISTVLEAALAFAFFRKRFHREVPWFGVLILYRLCAGFIVYPFYDRDDRTGFFYWAWILEGGSFTIECMMLIDVIRKCLSGFVNIQRVARNLLIVVTLILVGLAVLSMPYGTEHSEGLMRFVQLAERTVRFVQAGVIVIFFALSSYLALNWRNYLFGIVLGYGLYCCGELAITAFAAQMGPDVGYRIMLLQQCVYYATLITWFVYLIQSEPQSPRLPPESAQKNLELWDETLRDVMKR
jgi:hypothetical protein